MLVLGPFGTRVLVGWALTVEVSPADGSFILHLVIYATGSLTLTCCHSQGVSPLKPSALPHTPTLASQVCV